MGIRSVLILLTVAISTMSSAQGPTNRAELLAAKGEVDEQAAVRASSEILIAAPADKVWTILVGVDQWPKWQPDITAAKIAGPLITGTEFKWTIGRAKITSRLALVKLDEELAWTGTALHTSAIHVWQLRAGPNGCTLVSTRESMTGFMLKLFYSSKDLEKSQKEWLNALKHEAER